MAEFVIKRIDATNDDPIKDARGCYKRGDIIDILEDGMADTMPWLTVIKVPGLAVSTIQHFVDSVMGLDENGNEVVKIRRKYQIPSNVMNTIFPNDKVTQYTRTNTQFNTFKNGITVKT